MFLPNAQGNVFSESERRRSGLGWPRNVALDTNSRTLDARQPSGAVIGYRYVAPPARKFTSHEVCTSLNRISRQTYADYIVEHPLGAIVEFPESGKDIGETVLHWFTVEPFDFVPPKDNVQFSLGDAHSIRYGVDCGPILSQQNGSHALCTQEYIACKGLKLCERNSSMPPCLLVPKLKDFPGKEVFLKTLALYCVLEEKGCAFRADTTDGDGFMFSATFNESDESERDSEYDSDNSDSDRSSSSRVYTRGPPKHPLQCNGKMVLQYNQYGRPIIQCQFRSRVNKAHLILSNLDEFHIPYLQSLLAHDLPVILEYEQHAYVNGYGPLIACTYSAAPSAQRQLCPNFHRFDDGSLRRGILTRKSKPCPTIFNIYTPENLVDCPRIVILSRNPHSHPNPFPVNTPPPLLQLFKSLLKDLEWKLADATPRRILIDSGFMQNLKRNIVWTKIHDPSLSDLHPSFGNSDHVRRIIHNVREEFYPDGTGFEGIVRLVKQHDQLPAEQKYVRCAEKHLLPDNKILYLVICMSRAMARWLMRAKYLSIDTSFKRVQGDWQEFEMESWDPDHLRSVVGVRAFTTSQSGHAHYILFTRIFEIAEIDTGLPPRFLHIHGEGFQLWVADAHKGQALGAGMYCQSLCTSITSPCLRESGRLLRDLDAYEHLKRFFRLCSIHYKRKITEMKSQISSEVRDAMLSIASSRVHPDLDGAFKIIERGGKKARAWLKDKRVTNKFALPALYQPYSLIPLDVWQAAPKDTNGNEQGHENVARDGVNLTLLGATFRGMNYDFRAMESLVLHAQLGINLRDDLSTHFERARRSVTRTIKVQHKIQGQNLLGSEKNPSQLHYGSPMPRQPVNSTTTLDENLPMVAIHDLSNPQRVTPNPTTRNDEWPNSDFSFNLSGIDDSPDIGEIPVFLPLEHLPVMEEWESIHEVIPEHLISTFSSLDGALG